MFVHSSEKLFEYGKCNKTLVYTMNLKKPLPTHTGEKALECNVSDYRCKEEITFKEQLQIHDEKPFQCDSFDCNCLYKKELKEHTTKPCKYEVIEESVLNKQHVESEEGPFTCDVCKYNSASESDLMCHKLCHNDKTMHNPINVNVGSIVEQPVDNENKPDLKITVVEHSPLNSIKTEFDTPAVCIMKDNITNSTDKDEINIFNDRQCGSRKSIECNLCSQTFVSKSNLKKHMLLHTGEKPFKCHLCGYRSIEKSRAKEHIYTHMAKKVFYCNLCDYKCSIKKQLKDHSRSKHQNDKPYKCNLCDHGTISKYFLSRHMLTHTKGRPFACHLCNYKAKEETYLKRHMLRHIGEKPYGCDICNYRCEDKSELTKHKSRHNPEVVSYSVLSSENLFKCNLCEYKTTEESAFNSPHINVHRKESLAMQDLISAVIDNKYKPDLKIAVVEHSPLSSIKTELDT